MMRNLKTDFNTDKVVSGFPFFVFFKMGGGGRGGATSLKIYLTLLKRSKTFHLR